MQLIAYRDKTMSHSLPSPLSHSLQINSIELIERRSQIERGWEVRTDANRVISL